MSPNDDMSNRGSVGSVQQNCREGEADSPQPDTVALLAPIPQSEAALQLAAALAAKHDAHLIGLCIINVLKMDFGILPDRITLAFSGEPPEPNAMDEDDTALRDADADPAGHQPWIYETRE
jgi:hypothetical protein